MTEEIPEGYKRCSKCGEVKSVEEFYKNKCHKDGLHNYCKICTREINKKHHEENKEAALDKMKKYDRCVKKPSCPAVGGNGAKFVVLTCPICGKEFRRRKAWVDYQYENKGQTHFYCSRECQYESMRKSHTTEYEKNIKRIRKEQRL